MVLASCSGVLLMLLLLVFIIKTRSTTDFFQLQDCEFIKKRENTSLRVVYQGNYFLDCDNCCKRWFITFNGAECRGPMAIDAVLWIPSRKQPIHIPGYLEGYCENVHRGKIRVGINIGNCVGYGNSNGRTGWNSVSRLIIEEVPKPQ